jgi:phage N-6-adenine-methyltransferase
MNAGLFSSRTEEWSTPQYVFDALDAEFHFTLDVCADDKNHKCAKYLTKEQDGLKQPWDEYQISKVCWMNPPYGPTIGLWMKKAYEESCAGVTVVCLVHARTDTRWWHEYAMQADEIRFVKGRLKFGDGAGSAPFPSAVVIFRPMLDKTSHYNTPRISSVAFENRGKHGQESESPLV